MLSSAPSSTTTPLFAGRSPSRTAALAAMGVFCLLLLALSFTVLFPLAQLWHDSEQLSHGPALWILAGVLLWLQKENLRGFQAASPLGFTLLVCAALLHVGAIWADIAFLKPLSFLGMAAGGIYFLGGKAVWKASGGAIGLLTFTLPWPTQLVEAVGFPLQLISSSYAALLSGLLGLPIVRDGVYLAVVPDIAKPPVYAIRVAAACSGLTSLMVLFAVAYLIAYFTPANWIRRTALVASVVPLAIFANALRLTFVLMAGAYHSAQLATWVHDHEQPVLVFLCSMGLLGLRQFLLMKPSAEESSPSDAP